MQTSPDDPPRPGGGDTEPAWPRPGAPNGWRRGRVLRTLWPPEPGTRRLAGLHGSALVCVRHREDPRGLRRVVTVELVVGPVRTWGGPRGTLGARAIYALRLPARMPALRQALRDHGAWRERDTGLWRVRGAVIESLGLHDWLTTLEPLTARQRSPRSE